MIRARRAGDALAPELEAILLLAGSGDRRAECDARIRTVLARADFELLARELRDRRLLGLIGSRAIAAAGDAVPEGFRRQVNHARTTARARSLAVEAATRRAVGLLAASGIRALPLKGPLLAAGLHGDTGLRETSDADLLVPQAELEPACWLLMNDGWLEPADRRRRGGVPDLHFALDHPRRPSVELHWRIHWYEGDFAAAMLAGARPGDDGLLRPQPADLAASLLLYYARDGFHGVRLAADIAAFWDRHGADLPAAFLLGHMRRYPRLRPALTAAATAAERLTGTPVRSWLGAGVEMDRRAALAVRLADWTQDGERDQLAANISLVGGLLGPRRSVPDFVRRELVPDPARPGASAVHAFKMSARYAAAVWKVRGEREWADNPEAPA